MSKRDQRTWVKYLETIIEIAGIVLMLAPFLGRKGKRKK